MEHFLYNRIPVIDLFAGPGGLAEGFSAFQADRKNIFRIGLSVEKDKYAHSTLELRSFFRQFPPEKVPEEYYAYLRSEISRASLFSAYLEEAEAAREEAWCIELGLEGLSELEIDEKIKRALCDSKQWVLIGGPPCQAYSTVGRSRNKGKEGYVPEEDKRHFLYREYLRIIARHWPSVFVMENVKGMLSAKVNGSRLFDHILADLHDPLSALNSPNSGTVSGYKYRIYSLSKSVSYPFSSLQPGFAPTDFLIQSECYGIPQTRHRVILLGVREDLADVSPELLSPQEQISAEKILGDLPRLRSGLSREEDTFARWEKRVWDIVDSSLFDAIYDERERDVWDRIGVALSKLDAVKENGRGGEYVPFHTNCMKNEWYHDFRIKGVCNHTTKAHMPRDLHRYLFAACFAEVHGRSPSLPEFPRKLWPKHKNAHKARRSGNFSDRFRVQMASKPATTIMSHIAKDGHYYIHYDASQCRSLTVREAARLQTFPDNYFFEGPRTQQYTQVGNAVPPLLAHQLAGIVYDLLQNSESRWTD
jgi:DNA (cytosine-5)-methyltransferase 1